MSELTLTKTRLFEGIWEGVLKCSEGTRAKPRIDVTYLGEPVQDVSVDLADEPGLWRLRFPIPKESISDGVQTVVITEHTTEKRLDTVSFIAGEALAGDLRAEIDLLRAELDMLKRAFRRHCVETM
ncbi:hypothetical protein [Shimia sagamensis]|uniref:SCP2 domain-containing protein n=1 Tax=Shimia sagamensis TaxID=1566352 RepID=A0ABY1NV64_9RHOB|nr:hypothetical protein [Shimia sagamensis]SMP17820.1 hypothetical protein SAMN06265373_103195 [Shimia sagamensis]